MSLDQTHRHPLTKDHPTIAGLQSENLIPFTSVTPCSCFPHFKSLGLGFKILPFDPAQLSTLDEAVRVLGHLQAPKRINWFVIIIGRRRQQQQVHHVAILLYKPISVQETSCSAFKMMIDHGTCWPPPDGSPRRLLAERAIFCPPVNKSVQLKIYKCVNIDGKRKKADDRSQMAVLTALATLAAFTVSSAPEGGGYF